MERETVLRFIKESGVRTRDDIYAQFPEENREIIDASIDYMAMKNIVRKARYDSPGGISEIYFIPPGSDA